MADKNLQAAASPVEDEVVKQAQRRPPLAAMLLDNNKNNKRILLLSVSFWSLFNSLLFAGLAIATAILQFSSCSSSTKSAYFVCVTLTDEAADEVWYLMCGEVLCSAAVAVALAAPLQMLLTTSATGTTTSRRCRVLLWVALAASVGMHGMKLASDRIVLAAAGHESTFRVAFPYVCLAVDLVAAVILCFCYPRRRLELGEHLQGGDDNGKF